MEYRHTVEHLVGGDLHHEHIDLPRNNEMMYSAVDERAGTPYLIGMLKRPMRSKADHLKTEEEVILEALRVHGENNPFQIGKIVEMNADNVRYWVRKMEKAGRLKARSKISKKTFKPMTMYRLPETT
jgi:hypothetical protein